MAASYPTSTKSFSVKNPLQTIASAHVNDMQDEIVAIETDLRAGQIGGTPVAVAGATLVFGAGSAATPSVAVREADVGMYSSAANALELATNGVKAFGIDATQFIDSPTQPRCQVFHNTTQSLTTGTPAAILFNSEDHDVASMHDTGSNTSRITIPTGGDGTYLLCATVSLISPGGNSFSVSWKKNGTTNISTASIASAPTMGGSPNQVMNSCLVVLAAADYVEVFASQDSGGSLNSGSATRINSNQAFAVKLW